MITDPATIRAQESLIRAKGVNDHFFGTTYFVHWLRNPMNFHLHIKLTSHLSISNITKKDE
uniref:Uncharacterized protein n=1 Tax=viral metagenome TaxID=1070528 RepID=A0A6C0BB59_9ZZZZ